MLPVTESQQAVKKFFTTLKELRSEPYLIKEEIEAIRLLQKILSDIGCKFAVIAGLPPRVRKLVEHALEGFSYSIVEELKDSEAVNTISRADAGITWVEYGVVNQGALLEVAYDDAARLASSLPLNHIALLSSKNLLLDIGDAFSKIAEMLSMSEKKPAISLISGPSKTGDIEMRLLYGVHGPNSLYVLMLDWL
jgi:L-lactate dehydrogenase complex protein LldG